MKKSDLKMLGKCALLLVGVSWLASVFSHGHGTQASRSAGVSSSNGKADVRLEHEYMYKERFSDPTIETHFTLVNDSNDAVKDVEVECALLAPSGTQLQSATNTIYNNFPPHSRSLAWFDMGVIDDQVKSETCTVKSYK